ncbi:MAG: hypothetical protein V4819_12045 [Verrucomicrobiota bacterium]
MGKLTYIRAGGLSASLRRPCRLLLGLALGSSAFAQSSANFDTKAIAPVPAETAVASDAKPVAAAVVAPVSTTPSRHISAVEMKPYTDSVAAVFLIRGRARDSFGQNQDPDAKPVVKASAPLAVRRAVSAQATPFADIVRLLVVTTIMPGEKRFLVGTRSFKQGDIMPLNFRSKQIRAMITEVTSKQISFRNQESGETAVRKLDMLPAGMTPGQNGVTPPGMVPDQPNAPIDLEAADSAASISNN